MKTRFTVTFILCFLMVMVPVSIARHLLHLSRLDSIKGDAPNFLSHQQPSPTVDTIAGAPNINIPKRPNAGQEIPRTFMVRLPHSLPYIKNARTKKNLFVQTMLPLVLRSNELILEERDLLLKLEQSMANGKAPSNRQQRWLKEIKAKYRIPKTLSAQEALQLLLQRVDLIPPSLAITQAAIESGWGTSRFSQTGNALFGEWVWGNDAKGLLPERREAGATHKIRVFDYLLESVQAYMLNLNRHRAYKGLRERRIELRNHGLPVTGAALAPALIDYSERKDAYVNDLLSIMNYNRFADFDLARLKPRKTQNL